METMKETSVRKRRVWPWVLACVLVLAAAGVTAFLLWPRPLVTATGFVAADLETAPIYDDAGAQSGELVRGTAVTYVVDAISAMPYPDHYGASGDWLPWEHPYDIMSSFGGGAAKRQTEAPTPAAVRTWIQAYNAIHEPYTYYGPDQVAAQIKALEDTGNTGGYMTWNAASSIQKYKSLMSAFK